MEQLGLSSKMFRGCWCESVRSVVRWHRVKRRRDGRRAVTECVPRLFSPHQISFLLPLRGAFIPPFQCAAGVFHAHHFDSAGAHWTALIVVRGHMWFIHTSRCNAVAL